MGEGPNVRGPERGEGSAVRAGPVLGRGSVMGRGGGGVCGGGGGSVGEGSAVGAGSEPREGPREPDHRLWSLPPVAPPRALRLSAPPATSLAVPPSFCLPPLALYF